MKEQRELEDYLQFFGLKQLLPVLKQLNIDTLKRLGETNLDDIRNAASESDPSIVITAHDARLLTEKSIKKFRENMHAEMQQMLAKRGESGHLVFLSHFKHEAGTEAALMRSELEQLICDEQDSTSRFGVPVFLDSEDLNDLEDVQKQVQCSHNVALLLTRNVLTRPWCLVEIVTAIQMNIPVIPVQLEKKGNQFEFPGTDFYNDLKEGRVLDEGAVEVLRSCNIDLELIESSIKQVFKRIAVGYSPHKPGNIRRAELQELLRQLQHYRKGSDPDERKHYGFALSVGG